MKFYLTVLALLLFVVNLDIKAVAKPKIYLIETEDDDIIREENDYAIKEVFDTVEFTYEKNNKKMILGTFIKIGHLLLIGGYPVYKKYINKDDERLKLSFPAYAKYITENDKKLILFYDSSEDNWKVGRNRNEEYVLMKSQATNSTRRSPPSTGWKYLNGRQYTEEQSIKATLKVNGQAGTLEKPNGRRGIVDIHITIFSCFPGTSLVMMDGGELKRMEDLKIGDPILTIGNDGLLMSTKIIGFLDKKVNTTGDYLNMLLDDDKRLFISHRHTMFIKEEDEIKGILAQDVSIGDTVAVSDGKGSGLSAVKDISIVPMKGAYVPLTESGTLLVNGVLVSSYTNTEHHWLAHMAFYPIRWFPNLLLDNEESQYMEGIRTVPRLLRSVANIFGLVTLADGKNENCTIRRPALPPFQMATQKMNNEL